MAIVYKIYERSEDGLLKVPTEWKYGHQETIFNEWYGYETPEEAVADIESAKITKKHWGNNLIIVMEYSK